MGSSIQREGLTLRMEISFVEEVGTHIMWVDISAGACGNVLITSIFSAK